MNNYFKNTRQSLLLALMAALALALAGCGGGGGGSSAPSSSMSLSITDAPVDGVTAVVIEFTEVQVHSSTGTQNFVLAAPKQIDLLQLTNGKSEFLLDDQPLPAGDYQWVRLFVNEANSYVTNSTGNHPLQIPGLGNGQNDILKVNRPFTISADGVAAFVIDFDLRKSLHLPSAAGKPYTLRPTLRMVSATVVGGIKGTVDATLVNDAACTDLTDSGGTVGGAVYVYSGADAPPVDVNINLTTGQPVTTATVTLNTTDGQWHYTVAYLDPGMAGMDYTVAFTCQSSLDFPDTTDGIAFQGPANVHVISGPYAIHNFAPIVP